MPRSVTAPALPLTPLATIGAVAAGIALLEVALVPGIVIGVAAVLAPNLMPSLSRRVRRGLRATLSRSTAQSAAAQAAPTLAQLGRALVASPSRFTLTQAIVKTITFRVIVTSLDFTVNYVVLGELTTAAGLSAFALVVGPLFYLAHETIWNNFGDANKRVNLTVLLRRSDAEARPGDRPGLTISRALAKTITFRTIATTMDFTVNYVVVGDVAIAATLSASGFILGPFVYFGHEWLWDRYGSLAGPAAELQPPLRRQAET